MSEDQINIKTPEYVSIQFQSAGLGSRASAFIIDQLILMAVNTVILVIMFIVLAGQSEFFFFSALTTAPVAIAIILIFIVNWGYFFALEFFYGGRTIGKKITGIRVIQENGHSITVLSSFIRNFLRIVDSLPTGYLVGMLMIFFHSKHKRVGDLVAGTIVVHERKAKSKKKLSPIEKEIEIRGLTLEHLVIEEWKLKTLGQKEYDLVKTYSQRLLQLPSYERNEFTLKVANILLPKLGLEVEGKNDSEMENALLVLYLYLKDEWEFEL
ncbi:RDD family protein [Litchfieldia alkalitelluris]|uniref:RDD family protein n=1 Tax=Litchfieldia alkalitelluris TaxID=304268 RepID=UPI0009975D8F|nr:RDD family protein [Litchfieldia alkalitelluris]